MGIWDSEKLSVEWHVINIKCKKVTNLFVLFDFLVFDA